MHPGTGIEAIVFDAFGTLVTPVARFGPYHALAKAAGVDPVAYRMEVLTENLSISELAERHGAGSMAASLEAGVAAETAGCRLFPEAEEVFRYIEHRLGMRYAVCSNLGHGYGHRVRELVPAAAAHAFSYEVGAAKPDPAMYRAAAEALGVEASRILFVGDTPKADVEGPRAFGMRAVLVERSAGVNLARATLMGLRGNP